MVSNSNALIAGIAYGGYARKVSNYEGLKATRLAIKTLV